MFRFPTRRIHRSGGGGSDVSLEIQPGACVLLCGKSGCGKTTICKLVNGLIPHFETGKKTGIVLLEGTDTEKMPMYQIALKVASIFQDPKSQFFNIDTEDEIVFSLENQGADLTLVEERLKTTIEELHISSLMKKSLFEMSGGEKQIIAFACAYASDPDILVMDEPSSNLDLGAMEIIGEILFKMKRQGKTVIIAEHRFSYLKGLIDTAVYIGQGKIHTCYTAAEFYSLPEQVRKDMGLRRLNAEEKISIDAADFPQSKTPAHSLELKNVGIAFGNHTILENISFALHSGDIAAIVGINGVGKTSLCRTICGFLESRYGEIRIDGHVLKKRQRLKKSYIVMQDTNYQLFAESVFDECLLGNPMASKERVTETLQSLELVDEMENHPQSLSGGQKQRLAIAVAILAGKQIVILDEPTSGLDYTSMMRVSKLIKELSEMGIILLIITHDMEFLEATCNKCFQLSAKGIKETASIQRDKLFSRCLNSVLEEGGFPERKR